MITLNEPSPSAKNAFLSLGFRPFFLAAAVFAIASMSVWTADYTFNIRLQVHAIPSFTWHAHEMVFGYSMAVIAGFLLTAVSNWTGAPTLTGAPLLLLLLLWVIARLLPFATPLVTIPLALIAVVDCLFLATLILAIGIPLIRARQWKNLALVTKLVLMLISHIAFYLGALGVITDGMYLGLYSAFYLVIALILTMGRRVIPGFIQNGVDETVTLKNWRWLDISSLVLFVAFWVAELTAPNHRVVALLCGVLFVLHCIRLAGWYTRGIWQKPLLWVLYLAYAWITAGFAIKAASYSVGFSPFLAVHAFAVGGIGLITLGMMARVSLGHTGRNVFEPPSVLAWIFGLLLCASLVRVFLPLLLPAHNLVWIGLSQALWIAAFLSFIALYFPMWIKPRVDALISASN